MGAESDSSAKEIGAIVQNVNSGIAQLSPREKAHVVERLEAFECWATLFKFYEKELADRQTASLEGFTNLARIQVSYLEDKFAAGETCAQAIKFFNLSYRDFYDQMVQRIFDFEDFAGEANILGKLIELFAAKEDKVACLERLCLLYEKKTFNEQNLHDCYASLLAIDPNNIKALKYFKLVFTQNYEWEKVVGVLTSLVQVQKHPRDVFRLAQELAAVLLYQLDRPQEALRIVENHCEGSPLDVSTLTYDAYQRLGDWRNCARVLRECILGAGDDHQRAALHFRLGVLQEKLGSLKEAALEYTKVISLQPDFFEAFENLLNIYLKNREFKNVLDILDKFQSRVDNPEISEQLSVAKNRLSDGLSSYERN